MAKNILEFPNAGTLGRNDFLHVIQGGLDKKMTFEQLPLATENSNGLVSKEYFKEHIRSFEVDINDFPANTKMRTGFFTGAIYYISDRSGKFEIIGVTSFTTPAFHIAGESFLSDGNTSGFLVARDITNGEISVTNKFSYAKNFRIVMV